MRSAGDAPGPAGTPPRVISPFRPDRDPLIHDRDVSKTEKLILISAAALVAVGIIVGSATGESALAGGLIAMAPVLVVGYQSVQTRRAVDAAREDAAASRQLAVEAQRDRELAVQPFVTAGDRASSGASGPGVSLRNIGRGPAIQLRVLQWHAGAVYWNPTAILLASGEWLPDTRNPLSDHPLLQLSKQRGATGVSDYIVSAGSPHDLVAFCLDQLGNRLRFNLRTGDPPAIWRASDPPPEWADSLSYR